MIGHLTRLGRRHPAPLTRRLRVDFSDGAWAELSALAERTGRTPGRVLSDGLGLTAYFEQVRRDGGRVLIADRHLTHAREVLLP